MSLIPPEWDSIDAPAIAIEPPGPRSRAILDRVERTAYPGLSHELTPLALESKRGWTVTDVDGNVYLDCASASASVPLGAGRPELLGPVTEALARFGNEDSHALVSELTATLGERLLEVSPASVSRYDIALNGTEAVEIAIKLMRRATGRPVIIGFHGSYHGESTLTAALGAEAAEISRGLASPTCPTPTPTGRLCAIRGRGAAGTRPSTTSATTCSSTSSTRPRSPA
jgi:4-aminobutyrate aminotransferase-like enzyme